MKNHREIKNKNESWKCMETRMRRPDKTGIRKNGVR